MYAMQTYITGDIYEDKNAKIWLEAKTNKVADGFAYIVMENGISKEFTLRNGKLEGKSTFFKEGYRLWHTSFYLNGIENGESLWYSEKVAFQIQLRQNFVNGKKEGKSYRYYENSGNLEEISYFKNGLLNGTSNLYYESGKTFSIQKYDEGITKSYTMFYENGNLMGEIEFISSTEENIKQKEKLLHQGDAIFYNDHFLSNHRKGKMFYLNGNLKSEYDIDGEKYQGLITTYKKNNTKEYEIIIKNKDEILGYSYSENKINKMTEAEIHNFRKTQEWRKGEGGISFY